MDFSSRTELLLGQKALNLISQKRVIVFGLGGVGSWCAESLVRSGVEHLSIVDGDTVCPSNINRQLVALHSTIGKKKVEVMKERLTDINPRASITAIPRFFTEEKAEEFHLEGYDYVIDCIDSLADKTFLLLYASTFKCQVFSSMGAALKLDPGKIRTAEFWKVRGCPLGAALRKKMRRAGQKPEKAIKCVYSEELNKAPAENKENGTIVHVTAIFGFTLASLCIQDILNNT